jgi:hypothetical protein
VNPNLTVYAMAEAIEREQLDARAARAHLAAEAAAPKASVSRPAHSLFRRLRWTTGATLLRAGALLQGSAKDIGTLRPVASEEAC